MTSFELWDVCEFVFIYLFSVVLAILIAIFDLTFIYFYRKHFEMFCDKKSTNKVEFETSKEKLIFGLHDNKMEIILFICFLF